MSPYKASTPASTARIRSAKAPAHGKRAHVRRAQVVHCVQNCVHKQALAPA